MWGHPLTLEDQFNMADRGSVALIKSDGSKLT